MANLDGMNPEFRQRLMAMVNASGGKLSINSGYRSVQEQAALWNNAVAKYGPQEARNWVAPPGHSNHGKGIAADLGGDMGWAHAHAAEFGLYFPLGNEPWHVEVVGSRSGHYAGEAGASQPASQAPAPQQKTMADGLAIVASLIPGTTEGAAPSAEPNTPSVNTAVLDTKPTDLTGKEEMPTSLPADSPGGGAGDVMDQVRQGFESVGRSDLAQMVGTPEFGAWVNAESGWDAQSVSPANNQGKANGGLFQFWFGHDWAAPYNQGGKFTMSPYQQAQLAATKFKLTPDRIRQFAAQIRSGSYKGWG